MAKSSYRKQSKQVQALWAVSFFVLIAIGALFVVAMNQSTQTKSQAASKMGEEFSNMTPVYRLVNNAGNHFYTISEQEAQIATKSFGYTQEGIGFHAFSLAGKAVVPVHRFTRSNGDKIYSVHYALPYLYGQSNQARATAEPKSIANLTRPPADATYEGTVFYAYAEENVNRVAVQELVDRANNHFYTTSEEEVRTAGQFGFSVRGVAFYVPVSEFLIGDPYPSPTPVIWGDPAPSVFPSGAGRMPKSR